MPTRNFWLLCPYHVWNGWWRAWTSPHGPASLLTWSGWWRASASAKASGIYVELFACLHSICAFHFKCHIVGDIWVGHLDIWVGHLANLVWRWKGVKTLFAWWPGQYSETTKSSLAVSLSDSPIDSQDSICHLFVISFGSAHSTRARQ